MSLVSKAAAIALLPGLFLPAPSYAFRVEQPVEADQLEWLQQELLVGSAGLEEETVKAAIVILKGWVGRMPAQIQTAFGEFGDPQWEALIRDTDTVIAGLVAGDKIKKSQGSRIKSDVINAVRQAEKAVLPKPVDWRDQVIDILADGYRIRAADLRGRLSENDLGAFRFDKGIPLQELLRLYADALGASPPPVVITRMAERIRPLMQPNTVNMLEVSQAMDRLQQAPTFAEFNRRLGDVETVIRTKLSQVPAADRLQWIALERLIEPATFSPAETAAIQDAFLKVMRAYDPSPAAQARVAQLYQWTRPASLRAIVQRLVDMGIHYDTQRALFLNTFRMIFVGAALRAHATYFHPPGPGVPPAMQMSRAESGTSVARFEGAAAHEAVHAEMMRAAPAFWHQGARIVPADWITSGSEMVVWEWVSEERGEPGFSQVATAPPVSGIGPAVVLWLYQQGRDAAADPTQWPSLLASLNFLPDNVAHYARGVVIGGIARGIGQQIADRRPGTNPHERALRFLAWFAMYATAQSAQELVRNAQIFLALPGNVGAGLEEAPLLVGQLIQIIDPGDPGVVQQRGYAEIAVAEGGSLLFEASRYTENQMIEELYYLIRREPSGVALLFEGQFAVVTEKNRPVTVTFGPGDPWAGAVRPPDSKTGFYLPETNGIRVLPSVGGVLVQWSEASLGGMVYTVFARKAPAAPDAGLEDSRGVLLRVQERVDGFQSVSGPNSPWVVVIGRSIAERFPGLQVLGSVWGRRIVVDRGDAAATMARTASLGAAVHFYGVPEEIALFAPLADRAGLELIPHDPSGRSFSFLVQEILRYLGIPAEVIQSGLAEFADDLQKLASSA